MLFMVEDDCCILCGCGVVWCGDVVVSRLHVDANNRKRKCSNHFVEASINNSLISIHDPSAYGVPS